jgi:F420-dependent oxidoreductase-like protein
VTAGVVIRPNPAAANTVEDALWQAHTAHDCGVRRVWFGRRYDLDALMLAAVVGASIPDLAVGTAIVPINPRHPLLVASAAQTAQAAAHGNFTLGIGLGGNDIERRSFGMAPGKQMTRLREYLTVLNAIFRQGTVDFDGLEISAHSELPPVVPEGRPMPVYVAAMGPKALEVAGGSADGRATDHRRTDQTDHRRRCCRRRTSRTSDHHLDTGGGHHRPGARPGGGGQEPELL